MRFRSTAAAKRLVRKLSAEFSHGFQRALFDYMTIAWPDLRYAPDLVSRLDRHGVDLYSGDPPDLELVVQAKGLQRPFGLTHLQDSIRSIDKFGESDYQAREYWLVVNRPVLEREHREALDQAIATLVNQGGAHAAEWMDLGGFVNKLHDKLMQQLLHELPEHNRERLQIYTSAMRGDRPYMADIPYAGRIQRIRGSRGRRDPYRIDYVAVEGRDLLSELVAQFASARARRDPAEGAQQSLIRAILSEFGFGKTSLLLELANALSNSSRPALYASIAEFSDLAFRSEYQFVSALHSLVMSPSGEDDGNDIDLPMQVFRSALRRHSDFVLLLDGLDEHHSLYQLDGLTRFFECLRGMACDIIISARKEFWMTYEGNLEHAMKGLDTDRVFYELSDWDQQAILEYLGAFVPTPEVERMSRIVAEGSYEEVYGDIPKRPLFLEMLLEHDLEDEGAEPRTLLDLYTAGLLRKLERDIAAPFARAGEGGRPMPEGDVDLIDLRRRVFSMLADLAGRTVEIDEEQMLFSINETFSDSELREAAVDAGISSASSVRLLLHSLVVPAARQSFHEGPVFKFAHRSYQEYFIAHSMSEVSIPDCVTVPPLILAFWKDMRHPAVEGGSRGV